MRTISKTLFFNKSFISFKSINPFSTMKYTKHHEWVEIISQQKKIKVGITNYAQQQLGQIVHVQLPTLGKVIKAEDSALTIESVKVAADVYTPASGNISGVNEDVRGNPTLINQKADTTWLYELTYTSEPENLLTSEQYKKLVEEQSH